MYTVNKGASKLVAKTRSGLSQNYDKIESIREISRPMMDGGRLGGDNDISIAKPVFQQYRRSHSNRHSAHDSRHNGQHKQLYHSQYQQQAEQVTPQYEDMVKYIRDSWDLVVAQNHNDKMNDVDVANGDAAAISVTDDAEEQFARHATTQNGGSNTSAMHSLIPPVSRTAKVYYHNDPPSPALKDFGSFDLESWWGRRLFNNITKNL